MPAERTQARVTPTRNLGHRDAGSRICDKILTIHKSCRLASQIDILCQPLGAKRGNPDKPWRTGLPPPMRSGDKGPLPTYQALALELKHRQPPSSLLLFQEPGLHLANFRYKRLKSGEHGACCTCNENVEAKNQPL